VYARYRKNGASLLHRAVDHVDRVLGDRVGEVELGVSDVDDLEAVHEDPGGVVVRRAAVEAPELVEASLEGRHGRPRSRRVEHVDVVRADVAPHVPLAAQERLVARRAQHLCDRRARFVEVALIPTVLLQHRCPRAAWRRIGEAAEGHPADTGLMWVQAGEQRRSRGTATSRVVHLRVAQAARGERVDVRCADLAAVATEVGEPHVVGEDHDEVRCLCHVPPNAMLTVALWTTSAEDRATRRA
jgi:hypothetical protein